MNAEQNGQVVVTAPETSQRDKESLGIAISQVRLRSHVALKKRYEFPLGKSPVYRLLNPNTELMAL